MMRTILVVVLVSVTGVAGCGITRSVGPLSHATPGWNVRWELYQPPTLAIPSAVQPMQANPTYYAIQGPQGAEWPKIQSRPHTFAQMPCGDPTPCEPPTKNAAQ
jgi:hypothetical protein